MYSVTFALEAPTWVRISGNWIMVNILLVAHPVVFSTWSNAEFCAQGKIPMSYYSYPSTNIRLICRAIKMLVLDEADEMLNKGFKEQIYDVYRYLPPATQVVLISATLPHEILEMTSKFMTDPIRILVKRWAGSGLSIVSPILMPFSLQWWVDSGRHQTVFRSRWARRMEIRYSVRSLWHTDHNTGRHLLQHKT